MHECILPGWAFWGYLQMWLNGLLNLLVEVEYGYTDMKNDGWWWITTKFVFFIHRFYTRLTSARNRIKAIEAASAAMTANLLDQTNLNSNQDPSLISSSLTNQNNNPPLHAFNNLEVILRRYCQTFRILICCSLILFKGSRVVSIKFLNLAHLVFT